MPERSTPETPVLFWRDRSRWRATPYQRADHGLALARVRVTKEVKRGAPETNKSKPTAPPRRPDRLEQPRAAETNKSKLRRARFFGTHARARNAGEKHARDPGAVLARPIALASDPVSTGRPRPGYLSARKGDKVRLNATGHPKPINLNLRHRPGGPIASSSLAPPETNKSKLRRWCQILRHPTREPGKVPERSTPEPPCRFGATDRVGERPRNNGQTTLSPSRARKADRRCLNAGHPKPINRTTTAPPRRRPIACELASLPPKPINLNYAAPDLRQPRAEGSRREARPRPRCCFGATPLVGERPRNNGQTTAWPSRAPARKGEKRG